MPPETAPLLLPSGRGKDARTYLEKKGIISRTPKIRSSDFGMVNACRFGYYLRRRLGLTQPLKVSEALVRGSWMHVALEKANSPEHVRNAHFTTALDARIEELRQIGQELELAPAAVLKMVDREKRDALTAKTWAEAALAYRNPRIPALRDGFLANFERPGNRCLGTEIILEWKNKEYPRTPFVAQLDALYYYEQSNALWIVDYKSTKKSCKERLQSCKLETQTKHYPWILQNLLAEGVLHNFFDLPADVKVGGMIHIAIRKPNIEMCGLDRPFHYQSEGKRSGVLAKGRHVKRDLWQASTYDLISNELLATSTEMAESDMLEWMHVNTGKKPERQYEGEPDPQLFFKRVADYFNGVGDYADQKGDRDVDPPVNISVTGASILQSSYFTEYKKMLDIVYKYATCEANPDNFDRTADGMSAAGGLSPYAPFYVTEPAQWPTIMRDERFIQQWRDEEVDAESTSQISFMENQ